jgi:hypothetical protein
MFSSTSVSDQEKRSFAVLMTLAISVAGIYAGVQAAKHSIDQIRARRQGLGQTNTTTAPSIVHINPPISPYMTVTSLRDDQDHFGTTISQSQPRTFHPNNHIELKQTQVTF